MVVEGVVLEEGVRYFCCSVVAKFWDVCLSNIEYQVPFLSALL